MITPVVSVIVATYKAGDYLREAIASALAQTLTNLEVVVSDDAANPEVRELCDAFGDPRIQYRSNPIKLGPAGNHSAGFGSARGHLISILNHDDIWKPTFLETVVPAFDDPRVSIAFCDHDVIDAKGQVLVTETTSNTRLWGRDLLVPGMQSETEKLVVRQSIPIAMGSVFLQSALPVSGIPIEAGPAYDLWLAYLLTRNGRAHYTPERLTAWRTHSFNLTSAANPDWIVGAARCWETMLTDKSFNSYRDQIQKKLTGCYRTLSRKCLAINDRASGKKWAAQAVAMNCMDWRNVFCYVVTFLPFVLVRWLMCRYFSFRHTISFLPMA